MKCVIICGGNMSDYSFMSRYLENAGLIIAADGGARHCRGLNVMPDILVGDFDSIKDEDYDAIEKSGSEIARFPTEKDKADGELAVDIALAKGCGSITMIGAIGSRLDHSLSNIFLLKRLADLGVEGMVADEKNEVRLIKGDIRLEYEEGAFVSLLPVAGDAAGVTTRGFYYPLEDALLKMGTTWGISNKFAGGQAVIDLKDGYLLVIKSRE